jgi:hypothetical protein
MMTLQLPPSPNWNQLESTPPQQTLRPFLKNNKENQSPGRTKLLTKANAAGETAASALHRGHIDK